MKKCALIFIALIFVAIFSTAESVAQEKSRRRINPVRTPATVTQSKNESKRDSIDLSKLPHYHNEDGFTVYIDSVNNREIIDSTSTQMLPKMTYPLLHSASVSADLWSPLTRAFGAKYGLVGFAAQVNMHNRYIPTFEFGLGKADYTPEDNNYTYKSGISPYFKIGMDYNFLYNSNPDYFMFAGVRYGMSAFKYQITDVTLNDPYWQESQVVNFPSQSAVAGYFELLFGVKVMVYKNWSLGWAFRYHRFVHQSNNEYGKPWYIPGYGTRNANVGASFSIYYTIPLDKFNKQTNRKQPSITEAEK